MIFQFKFINILIKKKLLRKNPVKIKKKLTKKKEEIPNCQSQPSWKVWLIRISHGKFTEIRTIKPKIKKKLA